MIAAATETAAMISFHIEDRSTKKVAGNGNDNRNALSGGMSMAPHSVNPPQACA